MVTEREREEIADRLDRQHCAEQKQRRDEEWRAIMKWNEDMARAIEYARWLQRTYGER